MGEERKYSYVSIDRYLPPCCLPSTLRTNIYTVFYRRRHFVIIPKFRPHPLPIKCELRCFFPFIIEPPQIFFFVKRCPKFISENAHSRHQPQKVKGGFSFCGKIHFALPQLPPPASTSLLPPSTLLPIQFLSFLPNFSLHLLSHQIQIRGNMLQLHTRTTLQVS